MNHHRTTATVGALLLAGTALLAGPTPAGATPATPAASSAPTAPGAPCPNQVNGAQCPEAGAGRGGRVVVTVELPAGSVQGGGGGGPTCPSADEEGREPGEGEGWMTYDEWRELNAPGVYDPGPPPSDDAVYWVFACLMRSGFEMGVDFDWWAVEQGWGTPDEPPEAGPTATDILEPLWAHVQGLLLPPAPVLQPDEDVRSNLKIPTFVAITNPQPATEYRTTYAGITVWITVDPTVTLHPGEPGAAAVACDDDGTTYDPAGTPPRDQAAADGACAHTYERRTGVRGRPAAWTGDVTITWDVAWGSSEPGQSGTLTADPSVTTFQRIVDETQVVNTGSED
ncbi:MAG TPA: hypothetical protein VIL36_02205 [Acidimicrobiales bacterium]